MPRILARGIDVSGIALVINVFADNSEDYVHRIGRTGRTGLQAKQCVCCAKNIMILGDERLIKNLPIVGMPVLPPKRNIRNASGTRGTIVSW